MELKSIDFINGASDINVINKGYSGAVKYSFIKNNKKYFLKIGKFKVLENLEEILSGAGILHPKIIEFNKLDDELNYIILEYIEGKNIKDELNSRTEKFIYEYGFKIGKQYSNLRKKNIDKPVTDYMIEEYQKNINCVIDNLKSVLKENKLYLSKEAIKFIDFAIDYLEKNFDIFKNSKLVYGHTDVKPSNFILHDNQVFASDIEHTDYKEPSLSLIWSYARNDNKDNKNFAFARGYIDGLFNFNVPDNVLECFNYTYIFNMSKYIHQVSVDEIESIVKKVNENYIHDGQVIVSEKLKSEFCSIPLLRTCDTSIVNGSYDPDNMTFKCVSDDNKYFLKIMKISENRLYHILKNYKLLNEINIPISPIYNYGKCNEHCQFVISKYYDYKNLGASVKNKTFANGIKYGNLIASYMMKLKGKKLDNASFQGSKELYGEIMTYVDDIYKKEEHKKYIDWKYDEIVSYIKNYIKYFNESEIDLIHGDIKFGNILENGDQIIFVDNESLMYSFDIINFKYNIHTGFKKDSEFYQGFINGYLKYMNNGVIPESVKKQAILLFMYYIIRTVFDVLNKSGSTKDLSYYINVCEKYIKNGKDISWLK